MLSKSQICSYKCGVLPNKFNINLVIIKLNWLHSNQYSFQSRYNYDIPYCLQLMPLNYLHHKSIVVHQKSSIFHFFFSKVYPNEMPYWNNFYWKTTILHQNIAYFQLKPHLEYMPLGHVLYNPFIYLSCLIGLKVTWHRFYFLRYHTFNKFVQYILLLECHI